MGVHPDSASPLILPNYSEQGLSSETLLDGNLGKGLLFPTVCSSESLAYSFGRGEEA